MASSWLLLVGMGKVHISAQVFINLGFLTGLTTAVLLTFLIREYQKYLVARLIMENRILQVHAASIEELGSQGEYNLAKRGGIAVTVSCFGILLHSRVIKFNIDRIKLKTVEIGREYIAFYYSNGKRSRRIKIIHGRIDENELQSMIGKLRYETGVVPVIIDD